MSHPPTLPTAVGSDNRLHELLSMEDVGRPVVPEYIDIPATVPQRRRHDAQFTVGTDFGDASTRLIEAEQDVNAVVASSLRHLYMVGFIPNQEQYIQALSIVKTSKRRAKKITSPPADIVEHPARMDLA